MPSSEPLLIILEGNISAGKTTLAKELGNLLNCRVFLEPTLSNPYLELFYKDPAKYGLKMQIWLLRQRYFTFIGAVRHMLEKNQGVILDRSVFSDSVFANKGRVDGTISPEGFEYYSKLRLQMLSMLPPPHVTMYLKVSPETCHFRIHNTRMRNCESGIPLEYLAGLDTQYQIFVEDMRTLGSAVVMEDWENFGESSEVAGRVLAAKEAAQKSGSALGWDLEELNSLREFINDEERILQAIQCPSNGLEGIDDSDPLPRPHDFDLENKLELAAGYPSSPEKGSSSSSSSSA